MNNTLALMLKGAAMGIAEVIPGVSGGTIAFITGIYERLLNAIQSFKPSLFNTFKESGFNGVWKAIDGNFLAFLFIGMFGGIVVGIFGISHLIITFPEILWAFFFGLIIASAIYIGKQITEWTIIEGVTICVGIAVAYSITIISPSEGNSALWFVFISGVIAISALILPGISGSFILLLMGMYTIIIPTVKNALSLDIQSIITTAVFALGCLVGLMTFSRILSWTFKNYKNITLSLLTGFMIGSLNKIWPWRMPVECIDKTTGNALTNCDRNDDNIKILMESNLSPFNYQELTGYPSYFLWAIIAAILGFALVFILEKLDKKEN